MFTGWYQTAVILAFGVSYYVMDFALIARFDRQRQAEGSGRSWGYTTLMLATVAFVALQPVFLPGLGFRTEAAWGAVMQAVGLGVAVAGLGLHRWARTHLRHFYAERVELQPEHRIVDSGPYAYVRHPVFTSFFLSAFGLTLVNPALPMVALTIYTVWDFTRAAMQEEALLNQSLPGYADYMRRTARFFPSLWTHRSS